MRATALTLLAALNGCLLIATEAKAQVRSGDNAFDQRGNYAVDGSALGSPVNLATVMRDYKCSPSEQFSGFTWCQRTIRHREQRGVFEAIHSILHAKDGTIVYINRYQQPAFLNRPEAEQDIQRYTHLFGESPKISKLAPQFGPLAATIATWGRIELERLDGDSIKLLAEGKSPKKGFLLDYLGNLNRSAQDGLPIYRIQGGAGFAWAAQFDPNGRGTHRLVAVDTSALRPGPATSTEPAHSTEEREPARQDQAALGMKRGLDADNTIARLQSELSGARQDKAQAEETARLAMTNAEIARKRMEEASSSAEAAFEEIGRLKQAVVAPGPYLDGNNAVSIGFVAAMVLIVGVWIGSRASRWRTKQLTNTDKTIRTEHVERVSPPPATDQSGMDQHGLVRQLGSQRGVDEQTSPLMAEFLSDNDLEPLSPPEHAAPPIAAAGPLQQLLACNYELDSAISMVQSTVYTPSHYGVKALGYLMKESVIVQCSMSPPDGLLARNIASDIVPPPTMAPSGAVLSSAPRQKSRKRRRADRVK